MPDESAVAAAPASRRIGWTLRLAMGETPEAPPADWAGILDVAIEERCAALAWIRSGHFIRSHAPASETARWRTFAVTADAQARAQRRALTETLTALSKRELGVVVLKGAPLSFRLYGDASARVTDDIDLYVRAEHRSAAKDVLLALGWRPYYSESMFDDCYVRPASSGSTSYLEVHTALLSELLSHARLVDPIIEMCPLAGGEVPALAGAALPVYLAAHLAKHQTPSLLWYVDFATLWRSLDEEERREAEALATRARLAKWLAWACSRVALLAKAAEGDEIAQRGLGFLPSGRCATHGIREFITHSDTPLDAARVLGAIIWPRHLRGDLRGFVALSADRVRRRVIPAPESLSARPSAGAAI